MDRRIKRTRRLLGEALIDLLQEQEMSKITIRNITEHADIAYSTFFRNFDSIDDLLLAYLNDFVQTLAKRMMVESDAPYPIQARNTIRTLFELCQENPKLPRVLFQTPAARPVLNMFKSEQMHLNLQTVQTLNLDLSPDHPPLELILDNVMVQMFGMIDWWIDNDMQPTPAIMARYYEQLVLKPMWTILIGYENMMAMFK